MESESEGIADIILSSGLFASSGMISRFFGFLGHIAIVQSLPPDVFGNITISQAVVTTIIPIAVFGLGDGIPRLLAGSDSEAYDKKIISSGLISASGIGLTASIVVFLGAPIIADGFNNPSITPYLSILSIQIFFGVVWGALRGTLRGYRLSKALAISKDIAPKGTALIVLGLCVWILGPETGALSYYLSLPIISAVVAAAAIYYLVEYKPSRPSASHTKELFSFSIPLALSSTFVILMLNADMLFLGYLSSSTSVGYYRSVRPFSQLILIGLMSSVTIYMPLVTEFFESGRKDSVSRIYTVTTKWLAILTFPLVGVFVLFSPEVVVGFLSEEYKPAAIVLSILSIGMYGRVFVGPNGATTQAIGRPKIEFYAGILGVIVNICFNIVLIPSFGIAGAAIATSMGFTAYNILELTIIYREIGAHPFSMNMVKPLIPSTILGFILYSILPDGLSLPALIGVGIFWTLCQVLFVVATDSFDKMDRDILLEMDSELTTKLISYIDRVERS
ncbi:flippase [Haloferax massiliensis]|uniref:Putative cell division protein YtgP n=1 Tax=Haloferax massiliensis TaxID=1476858 RepID=A0A0D6JLD2_9EURY|nr:flippase [Haloferax massiliensis]CQR48722.1 putative cell division protein YtgP [Haloferax massiliensis]